MSIEPVESDPTDAHEEERRRIEADGKRGDALVATDPAAAKELACELVERSRAIGYQRAEAAAFHLLAKGCAALSDYGGSVEYAEESLRIVREIGAVEDEPGVLYTLGIAREWLGQLDEARRLFTLSACQARTVGRTSDEVFALDALGVLARTSGDYDLALDHHRRSLQLAIESGDAKAEGSARLGLGNTLARRGEFHAALEEFERLHDLALACGDRGMESYAIGSIANMNERLGNLSTALAFHIKSLRLAEELHNIWGTSASLHGIGTVYRELGEYAGALEALLRCLELAERSGGRISEARASSSLGLICRQIGEQGRSFDYFTRSLRIGQEVGDFQLVAFGQVHIGQFYQLIGEPAHALTPLFKGLTMFERSGDRYGESLTLNAIAAVYDSLGDLEKSIRYHRRALEIARGTDDHSGIVNALLGIGTVDACAGRFDEAIESFESALEICTRMKHSNGTREALRGLADAYQSMGETKSSARYRRMLQECVRAIFNDEATRRVSELIFAYDRSHTLDQAEKDGVPEEYLAEIEEAIGRRPSREHMSMKGERESSVAKSSERCEPSIVVRTFGEFQVIVDGRTISAAEWGRKRARDLFKLLLVNYHRTIAIDEIAETFWGEDSAHKRGQLVLNAVSHLRKALSPERRSRTEKSMLETIDRISYRLDLGECADIDFIRFKELIVAARRSSTAEGRFDLYEQAVALYHGDFLSEDLYERWSASERDLLKDAYLEALEFIAAEHLRMGRVEAIDAARRLLASESTCERAYEILLTTLVRRGRLGEAHRVVEECREAYRTELDIDPPERLLSIVGG